ncbi:MAG TPA: hypothetical protein VMF60_00910, partial [Acidimicrobiales bacterium]|nr:hypothetical protein [Acidimicrobiales bacterium]
AALQASLDACRARSADYELALTLRALVELESASGRPEVEQWRRESDAILAALGVEQLPSTGMLAPV